MLCSIVRRPRDRRRRRKCRSVADRAAVRRHTGMLNPAFHVNTRHIHENTQAKHTTLSRMFNFFFSRLQSFSGYGSVIIMLVNSTQSGERVHVLAIKASRALTIVPARCDLRHSESHSHTIWLLRLQLTCSFVEGTGCERILSSLSLNPSLANSSPSPIYIREDACVHITIMCTTPFRNIRAHNPLRK